MHLRRHFLLILIYFFTVKGIAQPIHQGGAAFTTNAAKPGADTAGNVFALKDCLTYALKNQPAVNQSEIDQLVAGRNNKIALSGWLPQVYGAASYGHYFQSPISVYPINGVLTPFYEGAFDYSTPVFGATENLFSADELLAVKAAKLSGMYAQQNTDNVKIELIADVTKAFYDLLLSMEQVGVLKQDTARLRKNRDDTYNQFLSGVADKVDYKQAGIALNNSMSQLKSAQEAISAKYAVLRQFMGVQREKQFTVKYDTAQMMQEIYVDTMETLQFEKRIEYQQLQTTKRIARETTQYYQLSILPSLSAFYNYNQEYEGYKLSELYDHAYPYSLFGLQLNLPLFTGFKRTENVKKAKLQQERIDWDEVNLKLGIYSEYEQALAKYKSNRYNLYEQRDNMQMAQEVYGVVKLQYSEGVKPYLDVIVAESDLQTSEINYLNALFQLLESKVDLQKALGDIPTEI